MEKPKLLNYSVHNTGLDASALGIFCYHVVFSTATQRSANHFCLDHRSQIASS